MAPPWLVKQRENIIGATSMFGAPFYGDRIVGRLVYGASKGKSWCEADDYEVPEDKAQATAATAEFKARVINVFLVRRGGTCSMRHKVRLASEKGAHAVIIVDKEDSRLTTKDMPNIIVSNTGVYNGEVHIPSILISKEDGKSLIDAAQQSTVIVALAWTVPTDKSVRMDMWMSSASVETMKFLKSFAPKRRVLNRAMNFVPHYSVFRMENADPTTATNLCSDMSGKFCAEDPDGNGPITGKMVLEEDVRQLCIHDKYKRTMGTAEEGGSTVVEYAAEYWDFIERYIERCPLAGGLYKFGEECSKQLMSEVGIDQGQVDECMQKTRDEKLQHEVENTAWSPRALRINGWRYSGILDADLVTKAVCSGFSMAPAECEEISKERDPFEPFNQPPQTGSGINFTTLLAWLVGALVVGCLAMFGYKRRLQEEMRANIREEVMLEVQAQYSKLAGK